MSPPANAGRLAADLSHRLNGVHHGAGVFAFVFAIRRQTPSSNLGGSEAFTCHFRSNGERSGSCGSFEFIHQRADGLLDCRLPKFLLQV